MSIFNSNYDYSESNTTTNQNQIYSEEPFNNLKWPKENSHFLCTQCWTIPIIEIKKNIILRCDCQSNEDNKIIISSQDLENYILMDNLDYFKDKEELFFCKAHNQQYKYFCENCMNLCEKCNVNHDNTHSNLINFDIYKHQIKENIKNLINKFELNSEETKDIFDNKNILKRLIGIIIYDYIENPSFNIIRNLKNIDINEIEINLNEEKKDTKREIKIYSSRELFDRIKGKKSNELELVQFIKIYQNDFYDIKILSELNLFNLIELDLKQNNIKNIEVLLNCNFPKLEKLYLDKNKIDDSNIKYISKFNFPELKDLSFNLNYFTKFEFFKSIEKLQNLIKLNIGSNKFLKETYKNENYNLNSIKELILSNGVFNDKTIFILSQFQMENIEIVDLSSNNLNSLSFVLNLNWPKLNTILLSNNNIKEIEPLNNFKNLKFIEIYDNLINDIDKVKKLTDENPNLKINLSLSNEECNSLNNIFINIHDKSTNIDSEN